MEGSVSFSGGDRVGTMLEVEEWRLRVAVPLWEAGIHVH